MWSSITYQPAQLVKAMVGGKVWQRSKPLPPDQRVKYPELPVLQPAGAPALAEAEAEAAEEAIPARPSLVQLRAQG